MESKLEKFLKTYKPVKVMRHGYLPDMERVRAMFKESPRQHETRYARART